MSILVIDIGSSSARTLIFDDQAQPFADAYAVSRHQLITEPDGAAILDPQALQAAVENCIDEVLQHPQAQHIQAVCMATLVGNMLGINAHGMPVTPLYTYADTRSVEDVELLDAIIDTETTYQRTGCRLHTAYHPARLHWINRTQPEIVRVVNRWIDIGAYLYHAWLGKDACSYSVAAWTGLLNRETLMWDGEWLRVLGLSPAKLPILSDYDTPLRGLQGDYASRWRVLRDVPFFLALGDGAAANVGSGCVDSSRIALTLGTTGAMRTVFRGAAPPVPNGLWSYRINAPLHLIGGATSEGGNIAAWLRNTYKIDAEAMLAELEHVEPDAHGLTVLPLFVGERSPGWNANAVGTIHGLRLSTSTLEIVQATLESVALRLALINEQLAGIADPSAVVVGGGGAIMNSRVWTQMIADSLNRPIHVTDEAEVTARGAAILALHALGLGRLDAYPPHIESVIEPRPYAVEKMRAARVRQQALYERLYG